MIRFQKILVCSCLIAGLWSCKTKSECIPNTLRPSAYPLITIDPYTSGWSFTDNLYDDVTRHWTGDKFPLIGVVKVDGQPYRFMGQEEPAFSILVPTAEQGAWEGAYTKTQPNGKWMESDFNDSSWLRGKASFGTHASASSVQTEWGGGEIWVRRTVDLPEDIAEHTVYLQYSNDDNAVIYVNGIEVVNTPDCHLRNKIKLPDTAAATLHPGRNVIAGYCLDRGGNALLDFGLATERDEKACFPETAMQKSVDVQATQTHYTFSCGSIDLKVTFTAPLLTDDLDLLSRPVNYITYEVVSNDGTAHDVALYFEASPEWALHEPAESSSEGFMRQDLCFLKTGSVSQHILGRKGDHVTIDWGYFYLAADNIRTAYRIGEAAQIRKAFLAGNMESSAATRTHTTQKLGLTRDLGRTKAASGYIMVGYDDLYSIQYFGENLRPYWNRTGNLTITDAFAAAGKAYPELKIRCDEFDRRLMEEAIKAGGREYAELCATAYRQAISAHKLVEAPNGDLLLLSKENFSNGSIGTVDITYPSAPLFLYYNPELAKGLLNHIFYYSESGRWTKPFPSHDIGTYPLANGQTYVGDMPVEEAGNMLILTAAIAHTEGNAAYAKKHWDVLTTWTNYLVAKGLDPENQLCTDDFAGHFAHNANLSVKAILGIASYGYLAHMLGDTQTARKYTDKARELAGYWMEMADDGDHYRLTFDKPGTWSQKYNLVWDKLFKWEVFPESVRKKEIAYYLTKQNRYGLPLDNRESYTKTDWIVWTATLADDQEAFRALISPIWKFANETTDRIPMSDWVYTEKPQHRGFRARSVVGGYWIKLLETQYGQ